MLECVCVCVCDLSIGLSDSLSIYLSIFALSHTYTVKLGGGWRVLYLVAGLLIWPVRSRQLSMLLTKLEFHSRQLLCRVQLSIPANANHHQQTTTDSNQAALCSDTHPPRTVS